MYCKPLSGSGTSVTPRRPRHRRSRAIRRGSGSPGPLVPTPDRLPETRPALDWVGDARCRSRRLQDQGNRPCVSQLGRIAAGQSVDVVPIQRFSLQRLVRLQSQETDPFAVCLQGGLVEPDLPRESRTRVSSTESARSCEALAFGILRDHQLDEIGVLNQGSKVRILPRQPLPCLERDAGQTSRQAARRHESEAQGTPRRSVRLASTCTRSY